MSAFFFFFFSFITVWVLIYRAFAVGNRIAKATETNTRTFYESLSPEAKARVDSAAAERKAAAAEWHRKRAYMIWVAIGAFLLFSLIQQAWS